jgi:hypothetical protein
MRTIRRVRDSLAMRWRIRRIVWQSEVLSLLGDIRDWGRLPSGSKPRVRIIRVSGRNIVRIR